MARLGLGGGRPSVFCATEYERAWPNVQREGAQSRNPVPLSPGVTRNLEPQAVGDLVHSFELCDARSSDEGRIPFPAWGRNKIW